MIKIRQSGDGLWKWKVGDMTWEGGYRTYGAALAAAEAAARGEQWQKAVVVVR